MCVLFPALTGVFFLFLFLFSGVGMLTLLEEPAVTDVEEVSIWEDLFLFETKEY